MSIQACLEEIPGLLNQTVESKKQFTIVAKSASKLKDSDNQLAKYLIRTLRETHQEFKELEDALNKKQKSLKKALVIVDIQEIQMILQAYVSENRKLLRVKISPKDTSRLFAVQNTIEVN